MKPTPIIGITADIDSKRHFLNRAYVAAVEQAGAIPLILPAGGLPLLDFVDGLLLSGGGDIHGRFFGQPLHEKAVDVEPLRDEAELGLAQRALDRDMPILGICRGMQLLNVVCGGNLFQHIEGHKQDAPRSLPTHQIKVEGKLAGLLGADNIMVNTIHHQAVDRVGDNFLVCAKACDGHIEAIWARDKAFVLGLQWHPEELISIPAHAAIFTAFAAASATLSRRRTCHSK